VPRASIAERKPFEVGEPVIVRVSPDDLEAVLANSPRMVEHTKQYSRDYFVRGMAMPDIARLRGIAHNDVANVVRMVRAKLEEAVAPSSQVELTMVLPYELGRELQQLVHALWQVTKEQGNDVSQDALSPVLAAVRRVNKALGRG
jgi:hypothetical protein